jgi:hypothetical protein
MNRKFFSAIASLFVAFCFSSISRADNLIVPGKRIGDIKLGMEHRDVLRILGTPHHEDDLDKTEALGSLNRETNYLIDPPEIIRDDWITPLPMPKEDSGETEFMCEFITVYFRERRVVQIEIRANRFKTADGLSCVNIVSAFENFFPQHEKTSARYSHLSSGGWPATKHFMIFEDAIKKGIGWRYGAMGNLAPDPQTEEPPETIVVHESGKPMIFDPDGGDRFIWKDAPIRPSGK